MQASLPRVEQRRIGRQGLKPAKLEPGSISSCITDVHDNLA